ncbi:MSCRAMM family protein [Enterococcus quebecensis]|uniref:Uncharacterized protein n=1 Tax=Enterococcus quebecensis TaxID=903983 RepID=A0A1E5GPY5_9ENTE|nr:SpaA isopeptide-forming pilin-related protein [Enterococcus quebecensis]OEG14635.1 hypothetical protein BCR23_12430 [Enterococcus quebecensis]OJG73317.1 hypothetical protein RV12_GL000724 [Enterococcus quebecensis]
MQKKMVKFLVLLLVLVQVIDVVGMFRHLSSVYAEEATEQSVTSSESESSQTSASSEIEETMDTTYLSVSQAQDAQIEKAIEIDAEKVTEDRSSISDESAYQQKQYEIKTDLFPQEKNEDHSPKLDYLTGEEITLYSKMVVSGGDFKSEDLRFRITLPKEYFAHYGVVSGGSSVLKSELSEDAENTYLDIYLKEVKTGTELSVPFKIKFHSDKLFHGTKGSVTQQLYYEEDKELASNSIELEATTINRAIHIRQSTTTIEVSGKYVTTDGLVSSDYVDEVKFFLQGKVSGNVGRAISDSIVEFQLTENTIFEPGDNGPEWVYNAENHSISRRIPKNEILKDYSFKVRYKNVKVNTPGYPVTFKATTRLLDSDGEIEYRVSEERAEAKRKFNKKAAGASIEKSMDWQNPKGIYYIEENKDALFLGEVYVHCTDDFDKSTVEKIVDTSEKIDGSNPFILKSAQVVAYGDVKIGGKAKLVGVYNKNGQEQKVILSEDVTKEVNLNDNENSYDSFYVEFDTPVELTQAGNGVGLKFTAKRSTEYWKYLETSLTTMFSYIHNSGTVHFGDGSKKSTYYMSLPTRKAIHSIALAQDQTKNKVFVDEIFDLTYRNFILKLDNKKLVNPKLHVIVPESVEVESITDYKWLAGGYSYSIEKNFSGTQKTAIIITPKEEWTMDDIDNLFSYKGLNISLKFNDSVRFGEQIIDSYFTYDNNGSTGIDMVMYNNTFIKSEEDPYKLISSNAENKELLKFSTSITVVPPLSLYVDTAAAVNGGEEFVTGKAEHVDQGTIIKQQLSVGNYSDEDISQLVGINVLPHKGDLTTIVGADGTHHPRGSDLGYVLDGPVEVPEGYTVYYSYEEPSGDMKVNMNKSWLSPEISTIDYSKVTMIKIVLNDNAILKQNETATFTFPAKIPIDATIKNDQKMANSFTVSTDKENKYWIESRVSEIPVTAYGIRGLVYQDTNKNSLKDIDEKGLEGYEVELVTNDVTYTVNTVTTDENGAYEFSNVTARGDYNVRIKTKDGDTISEYLQSTEEIIATDVKPDQLKAGVASIQLAPDKTAHRINMGLYSEPIPVTSSVELTKVDSVTKQVLEGAKFRLEAADGRVIQNELITNAEGKLLVENLPLGNYRFIETAAPIGYTLDETPVNVALIEEARANVTKENTPINVEGSVELIKIDSMTKRSLAGAKFRLEKSDGTVVYNDLTTNTEGKIVVENLPVGNYQFVEIAAPTGYILDQTPVTFTVNNFQKMISLMKENVKETGSDSYLPNDPSVSKGVGSNSNKTTGMFPRTGEQTLHSMIVVGYLVLMFLLITMYAKELSKKRNENHLNY